MSLTKKVIEKVPKRLTLKEKRQERFNELSVNLAVYTNGDIRKQVACPICLKLFNSIDELSDAHVFPAALGGRLVTLACRKCNSQVGSDIESYEVERAKLIRAFSGHGQGTYRANLRPLTSVQDGGKVVADFTYIQDDLKPTVRFNIIPGNFDPNVLSEIKQSRRSSGGGFSVGFTAKAGWARARLTYLHSAFLFLFHQFGYEWALDPCTQVVREQIQRPQEDLIGFNVIELVDFLGDKAKPSLNLIVEPKESKGFLVVFPKLDHWNSPVGVWMPLFDCPYKLPEALNLRVVPLPTLIAHLSTFNFMFSGHWLIQDFFS